ncbi:MAG: DUF362 domain-containing protein [Lachnospiraceae bacterium]
MEKDYVVVTQAAEIDYSVDYVALPKNYGTSEYFHRTDVKAIYKAVYDNLNELDDKIHFTKTLASYKHVLLKPNLVSVYHACGMEKNDYPESTDPRVFDAIVSFFMQYNSNIIIIESSGKPMPTTTSFRVSGINRIAKHYHIGLIPLETECVNRYMLPKAEVMKEVYIPHILEEVLRGEAFYVSVPKLKTNLYTKVTLGFKNAMGTLPYCLRERNHNYYINKKLADLLYLFTPNLVVIDGIIGGEGNTPAPVDPVEVGVIISGNNTVEVDRIGTIMIGYDPDTIPLIQEAVKRGFASESVEVIGEYKSYDFRRANASLMADEFHEKFPNVDVLAGHNLAHAPKVTAVDQVTKEIARELEMACDGGCLAALRSGFDYIIYSQNPKYDFPLTVVVGGGVLIDGVRYWFDRDANAFSEEQIRQSKKPILTLGNCALVLKDVAKYRTDGCCSPSACMLAVTAAAGIAFPLLSIKNKSVLDLGISIVAGVFKRSYHILMNRWVDCPSEHEDKIYGIPELSEVDLQRDYIEWPLPKMSWKLKWKLIKNQFSILKL